MDTRETTKLTKELEGILQDLNDDAKRGVKIEQYLYQKEEKRILILESLRNIMICLGKELEEREFGKKAELDYHPQVFEYNTDCDFRSNCGKCWIAEKLVFAVDGDMRIRIADRPHMSIGCAGTGVGNPAYQFCAVCLRGCVYQYNPSSECYIPKELYRREMFVFFLYSFDAFYACFKYCIEAGDRSLDEVFKDILLLAFKYEGLSDNKLEKNLKKDSSERAGVLKEILNNYRVMGTAGYSELNSILGYFTMAMRKKGSKIVDLLRNNEIKADKILGDKLLKKMLEELNKDWLKKIKDEYLKDKGLLF